MKKYIDAVLFGISLLLLVSVSVHAGNLKEFFMGTLASCASPPCDFPNSYDISTSTIANMAYVVVDIDGTLTVETYCKPCSNCPYFTDNIFTNSGAIRVIQSPCIDYKAQITAFTTGTASAWVVRP